MTLYGFEPQRNTFHDDSAIPLELIKVFGLHRTYNISKVLWLLEGFLGCSKSIGIKGVQRYLKMYIGTKKEYQGNPSET